MRCVLFGLLATAYVAIAYGNACDEQYHTCSPNTLCTTYSTYITNATHGYGCLAIDDVSESCGSTYIGTNYYHTYTIAKELAEKTYYNGIVGHLPTIFSADEDVYFHDACDNACWLGMRLYNYYWWSWDSGPERGRFYVYGVGLAHGAFNRMSVSTTYLDCSYYSYSNKAWYATYCSNSNYVAIEFDTAGCAVCEHGSYTQCETCGDGWSGTDCDADVNECTLGTHTCIPTIESCVNTVGSFTCTLQTYITTWGGRFYGGHMYFKSSYVYDYFTSAVARAAVFVNSYGEEGYVLTINSAAEETTLYNIGFLSDWTWLGLSDAACESCWLPPEGAGSDGEVYWTNPTDPSPTTYGYYHDFTYPPDNYLGYEHCSSYYYGYWGDVNCESTQTNTVSELKLTHCGSTAYPYSKECLTCETGYTGVGCTQDIDECNLELDKCSSSETCVNTAGSFVCECAAASCTFMCDYEHDIVCPGVNPTATTYSYATTAGDYDNLKGYGLPLTNAGVFYTMLVGGVIFVVIGTIATFQSGDYRRRVGGWCDACIAFLED